MGTRLPLPRFIEPASIQEGDTIRAAWHVGTVEHTRTALVGRIRQRTIFADDGQELFRWNPGKKTVRVTLLRPASEKTHPGLFELDQEIQDRAS